MGYGNRDKPERKSARAGFVDARLDELRRHGKIQRTSARRTRCPNKSASGNRLGQNDLHPPTIDDKDPCGVLRGALRELRNQQPHKPFISFLQLHEISAKAFDFPLLCRTVSPRQDSAL